MKLKMTLIAAALVTAGFSHAQSPDVARPLTVVTFGDSTTAVRGGAVNYTSQLEARFANRADAIRFINKGIGGNTTEMARRRFEKDVLAEKADLVVIQFGINDSAVDVWKTPPATESRVSLDKYQENLRYFIEEIRKGGGEVILMTPNQIRWGSKHILEKYAKPPYDPNDEKGFTLILANYAEAVRKIAAAQKVVSVDVYALYDQWEQANGTSCKKLMSDGMHPNTEGHKLVADALEPLLQAKISK